MHEILLGKPALPAFLLASLVLAATPGPGVIYILARTLAQGRRAGLASVAGVALGNFANALGASLGLAALLAISPPAFAVLKLVGALYLVYLGIRELGHEKAAADFSFRAGERKPPLQPIFRSGFAVALLNPKTALFFAAFLPQFVDPAASAIVQSIAFGSLFVCVAAVTDSLYVLGASAALALLQRRNGLRRCVRYLSAAVLVGLGVLAALT